MNAINSQTKTCRYCAETIPSAAKVCPRCRQWLTLRSISHPAYYLWISAAPVLIALSAWASLAIIKMERIMYPRPFYTEVPDSLRVTESKFDFRQTDSGVRLYVTGLVTNQSQIPWKDTEFECRFYDANQTMIDVAHPRPFMAIQPNDEAAFSITIRPARRTNDYSSFKLRVITARNAHGLF